MPETTEIKMDTIKIENANFEWRKFKGYHDFPVGSDVPEGQKRFWLASDFTIPPFTSQNEIDDVLENKVNENPELL